MDWMKVLFNTDHTMSLPAIIGIAVLGIAVSMWLQWYKNSHGPRGMGGSQGSAGGRSSGSAGGRSSGGKTGGSAGGRSGGKTGGSGGRSGAAGGSGKNGGQGSAPPRRNPTKKKKRR